MIWVVGIGGGSWWWELVVGVGSGSWWWELVVGDSRRSRFVCSVNAGVFGDLRGVVVVTTVELEVTRFVCSYR